MNAINLFIKRYGVYYTILYLRYKLNERPYCPIGQFLKYSALFFKTLTDL